MPELQPEQWLKWICASRDIDELRQNYDRWADAYDANVGDLWGAVPMAAAYMLAGHLGDKESAILDVGAGTGLVGAALAPLGFHEIVGIDLSPAMLSKAEEKGVYRALVCCAIGDEAFAALPRARGIVATGVFAQSHAGATELHALQGCIEPRGEHDEASCPRSKKP